MCHFSVKQSWTEQCNHLVSDLCFRHWRLFFQRKFCSAQSLDSQADSHNRAQLHTVRQRIFKYFPLFEYQSFDTTLIYN